jgi:hypothetical protein
LELRSHEAITVPQDTSDVARGRIVYNALFGTGTRRIALAGLMIAAALPQGGLKFTLCLFKVWTGLPCPGCGLTRSFTSAWHLAFADAVRYHALGLFVFSLFVVSAASNFVGDARRQRLEAFLIRHGRTAHRMYWAALIVFLAYGAVRLAVAAIHRLT